MSALDSLEEAIKAGKVIFDSIHPIDKVVGTGTVSVVNSGATTQAPQTAHIVTSTIANPYNKKVYVRGIFSVDGTNYNSLDSHLIYTFSMTIPGPSTSTLRGLKAGCSIGVSDSTIYFRTANGFHGNVTDDGVTYTYIPTSLTFTIKYALFEKE